MTILEMFFFIIVIIIWGQKKNTIHRQLWTNLKPKAFLKQNGKRVEIYSTVKCSETENKRNHKKEGEWAELCHLT